MALSNLTKVQTVGIGSNIEVVGVITTGQFKSGTSNLHSTGVELTNLNVSGIATIGGNLSIGGTLTYQDVTNIDSVGLITARNGINVSGGNLLITSGGALGINTSIPSTSQDLTLNGASNYKAGIFYKQAGVNQYRFMTEGGTGNVYYDLYGIGGSAVGDHIFRTKVKSSTIEALRITEDGKVGINTADPSYKFQVHDSSAGGLLRLLTGDSSTYDLRFVYQNSETNIWSYGTTDVTFGTRFNKKLHLVTNGPQKRVTIDDGGRVGIATASPQAQLHVKGTGEILRLETTASGGGQCYIDFDDETTTRASIGLRGSSSDTLTVAALNGSMRFDVSGKVQALQLTSTGNIQHDSAGSGHSYFRGSSEYVFGSNASSPPAGGSEASFQIQDMKTRAHFSINAYMNNAGGPLMQFVSSRSGTVGTLGTKVQSNDYIGEMRFFGDNATNYNTLAQGATIWARAKSTPGDGDTVIAGELHFSTGTGNAGSVTDKMVIQSDGQLDLKRGRVNDAGHMVYRVGGRIAGTATVSFDIPVLSDGNIYWIEAFYTHHSLSYGGYLYGVYGAYSGHSGLQINNTIGSSTAGGTNVGTWSVSRGNAGTPVVVAKSAGSYGGYGYYWIHVHAGTSPNL